jgi:hypothetical protein
VPRTRTLTWVAAAALTALFFWGLQQVVVAPIETGEVYPPYSSLRADPLGTKALYESLSELGGLNVSRLYKKRTALDNSGALLVLGVEPISWGAITQKTLTEYEDLVAKGGRLILGFMPVPSPKDVPQAQLVKERWDVHLNYFDEEPVEQSPGIPRDSSLYFEPGDSWTVVESDFGEPSAIERKFGAGTIVLVAQSYPLSNEGLREDRDAEQIAGLIGNARTITFDENHFGIEETGSVTTLVRKYHLEWSAMMLIVVALLFLWRSSSSLLPPRAVGAAQAVVGRDAQEGMVSLLERSLPEKELLDVCYAEWSRTAPGHRRSRQVEAEIARRDGRSIAETYRAALTAAKRNGEK